MKNKISAEIVADSINQQGDRITTMKVVFPRFILAEFNTHRLFSRNSASSRAIPFKKMVKMIKENLFIPIAWQKDHSGMQGTQYFEGWRAKVMEMAWIAGSKLTISAATKLNKLGLTKQLANRLLEPFMYHTVLVTATEWSNFFELRAPQYEIRGRFFKSKKDVSSYADTKLDLTIPDYNDELSWLKINKGQGEIHIMDLAEKMWDVMNESTPRLLQPGEWHIPFGDNIDGSKLWEVMNLNTSTKEADKLGITIDTVVKISTARCARLSYETLGDNPVIDYKKDIELYETLKASGHFSPFEHVARAMTDEEYYSNFKGNPRNITNAGWDANFRGFIQMRSLLNS